MLNFKIESKLKKYKELNGYKCKGYSTYTVSKHLCYKFDISEYEMSKALKKNKITIRII